MNLRKYFLVSAIVISIASVTSGCSLFGGEQDTIEVAPSPVIDTAFPLHQLWHNDLSGDTKIYSLLSPDAYLNVVYAASRKGQIKAIDLTTGNTLWNIDVSTSSLFSSQSALLSGGVTVDEKYVYVGSERATLYVLEKYTGMIMWQKEAKGEILAKPILVNDNLIVSTSNGYIQCFNRDSGNELWEITTEVPTLTLRGQSTPTLAYGAIVTGDNSGHVSAYFAKDGQLIWQQRISQPKGSTEIAKLNDVDSSPVIEQGLVYSVGYNGNIVALDLSDGQIIWKKPVGSYHSLVMNQNHLFAVDQNDNIYALTKNDGTVVWKLSDLLHRQLTDPVIYHDYIVVGDYEGYLYLIDSNTGNITAKTQVNSSGLLSKPLVVDNDLIIQAKNGDIYAYGLK